MYQFKLAKWGNSYAVRLPSKLVKEMGIKEGDLIDSELITNGAKLRAWLDAKRQRERMTLEEADAVMRESRRTFPKHLRPEDWKIDRNDPEMRG